MVSVANELVPGSSCLAGSVLEIPVPGLLHCLQTFIQNYSTGCRWTLSSTHNAT